MSIDSQASALDSGLFRYPELTANSSKVLVFRAVPGSYLDHFQKGSVVCQQTYRPRAEALRRLGFTLNPETTSTARLAIVFATKFKEETLFHLAEALSLLDEEGILIVAAANDLGAASLERRCEELIGRVSSYSKHKCRVFWGRKDSTRLNWELLDSWQRWGNLQTIAGTDLVACPGVFSWKNIDPGSRLLAEYLPEGLGGRGADLGAGYGYLSHALLSKSHQLVEWHLFEAELKALNAARQNLSTVASSTTLHDHWSDVTTGLPVNQLDCIVMNPPFHVERGADPKLGQSFIQAGLLALKPGGRLFLVANRHLPYEEVLDRQGCRWQTLGNRQGFKVIAARMTAS